MKPDWRRSVVCSKPAAECRRNPAGLDRQQKSLKRPGEQVGANERRLRRLVSTRRLEVWDRIAGAGATRRCRGGNGRVPGCGGSGELRQHGRCHERRGAGKRVADDNAQTAQTVL